jgi:hypothetical protein
MRAPSAVIVERTASTAVRAEGTVRPSQRRFREVSGQGTSEPANGERSRVQRASGWLQRRDHNSFKGLARGDRNITSAVAKP